MSSSETLPSLSGGKKMQRRSNPVPNKNISSTLPTASKPAPSISNRKNANDVDSVSRLGKLPGLSISRSDSKSQHLAKSAKSSSNDLSSQLQNELRRSKENVKPLPKPPRRNTTNQTTTSDAKKLSLKQSSGSSLILASTLPTGTFATSTSSTSVVSSSSTSVVETPAKPAITPPTDKDSPALQRKRLLEMIAAEKAEEEKKRKLKKARQDASQSKSAVKSGSTTPARVDKSTTDITQKISNLVKKEPVDQSPLLAANFKHHNPQQLNPATTSNNAGKLVNIKAEKVELVPETGNSAPNPPLPGFNNLITSFQPKESEASSVPGTLTSDQVDILTKQFQIKDYLSRKEMRSLAILTGLTDTQVRDWFKQKRIDEDVPTIVTEKPAEYQLNANAFSVKEEPQEYNDDYGFDELNHMNENEAPTVKEEPVVPDDDTEPDSSVLDPLTGKLIKQRRIDKDMETIMSKAPVLEALAKKMENVNKPQNSFKETFKAQFDNIIEILDDDIMITKENIINPGPKDKPVSKILNKFLSQVEELEKNIGEGNDTNFKLIRDNKRKDEELQDMTKEVQRQNSEISYLEKELQDKNDEIESILLNSVSKETFVRTQFQNLTTEVRKLRAEDCDKKSLMSKIKELEKQLKNKNHETEEWKEKLQQTLGNMKELEETSTNMIGEITKGVGEKLAQAKKREGDMAFIEEKNVFLLDSVSKLEKQIVLLSGESSAAKEEFSGKFKEQAAVLVQKDEEIVKLKAQVGNIQKRFRDKVREVQETLSKYNETLKTKNQEIAEYTLELSKLKENDSAQGKLITMLKESVTKLNNEKAKWSEKENTYKQKIENSDREVGEMKKRLEQRKKNDEINAPGSKVIAKRGPKSKQLKRKATELHFNPMSVNSSNIATKKFRIELSDDIRRTLSVSPLDTLKMPLFEKILQQSKKEKPIVIESKENVSWPIVPYYSNPLLVDLLKTFD